MNNIQSIKEIVQSSNLNFLIGAGASFPFLPLLNDIERRLSQERNSSRKIEIYKEFFEKVILPNLLPLRRKGSANRLRDANKTIGSYRDFFLVVAQILLKRKSTILSKQVNLFTTNIDILMEAALERSGLEYNDGFSGELDPIFNLSNFKKSISKRSLHFENVSEIPMFNLVKLHGSLTWRKNEERKIAFSKLADVKRSILRKTGRDFREHYKKLLIVNPEQKKLEETVLDLTYYEMLRMYSSELEKENTALFVIGFSMTDEHIQQITFRAANSNPTLKIYVFCHSKPKVAEMKRRFQVDKLKYSNVEIIEPEDGEATSQLTIDVVRESIFERVLELNEEHEAEE